MWHKVSKPDERQTKRSQGIEISLGTASAQSLVFGSSDILVPVSIPMIPSAGGGG